ncbi:MAG: rod shape-determining protein MreC [Solirubrobacterales bacterium]
MPTRKQIRRRRLTAGGLVALCLLILTMYFSEASGGVFHTMQRGAMEVLSPLQSLASGAIKPFRDGVNWVGDSVHAKSENKKLQGELADSRIEQARLQQAATENEQLKGLLNYKKSDDFPDGRTAVTARVIARSPTEWYGRVTINAGSSDGIRLNDPVIASGNNSGALVGKVTTVAGNASQVTLLTDSTSGVGALIAKRNILGVVKTGAGGEAGAEDLQMVYLEQRGPIRVGDMVVTSGTVEDPDKVDSIYPSGIPIGQVSEVDPEERSLYGRVHIEPYADMRDVQIVQVLTRGRG